jgi:diguanylate cyclase (GGDEF)-like protein/PAS domain S-box-containing protein
MNLDYAIALTLSAIVSTVVVVVCVNRRNAPGATGLALAMLAVAVWALTYAIRWTAADRAAQYFWLDATYLGVVTVPTALLVFALQFTNNSNLLTRRNILLLGIEPTLTFILLWTDPLHGLFYAGMRSTGTILNGGPWFWINVIYSYGINFVVLGLFVQAFRRAPHLYRKQTGTILIGMLIPFIGNVFCLARLNPFPDLDITPFAFIVTGLMFAFGLFRYRLLDIVPIARSKLIESMKDGVIVVDQQHRIVDTNPAAQGMLGISGVMIGLPAERVFDGWHDLSEKYLKSGEAWIEIITTQNPASNLEMQASPLFDGRRFLTGWLIILHDVTKGKKMEDTLRYQSTHDILTGLFNRQYYEAEIIKLQQSRCFPISILMMDMDGLKMINDRLGHSAGDELLRQAAQVIRSAFRPEDLVARVGGDEFVAVLPSTDTETALQVVQRLKNSLKKHNMSCSPDEALSLSIGTASGDQKSLLSEVFKKADQAMYDDKEVNKVKP